ncbi:general substrate transporter [Atractiella rhizophila]|nr:general substrate transporter [Atractiella rhizophila]KAH8917872.1 general substrate transporter [Atractiella rhizophila]
MNGVFITVGLDLRTSHELTSGQKELLTSITSAGAFIFALLAGFLADKWGRKSVMYLSTVVFVLGSVLQAVSYSFAQMVIGRLIVGFGVGLASMVVPLFIGEVAPQRYRGRLVVVDVLCITGGQLIAYAIDEAFYHVHKGWRYMVALGAIPAIVLFFLLPLIPETPRHLIRKGRDSDARAVIKKTFPFATDEQLDHKIELLRMVILSSPDGGQGSWWTSTKALCKEMYTKGPNLRALVSACGSMAFQQFCGFNTLMYYSATIFQTVGFTSNPLLISLTVSATNFVFTNVSLLLVDRIGRRRILLWSAWIMPVALVIAAIAFDHVPQDDSGNPITSNGQGSGWASNLVLASMLIYVAGYATGLGNVPWTTSEFFPLRVRAFAASNITLFNWGPNILVSSTFLSLLHSITPSGAFGLYAAVCTIGYVFIYFFFPEACGLAIEEVPSLFQNGFGVKESKRRRNERRERLREQRKELTEQKTVG